MPERPVDLGELRRAGEAAIAAVAQAPVRHVTREFLDALNCRDVLGHPPAALEAVASS